MPPEALPIPRSFILQKDTAMSVSYTHLDVYKRQTLFVEKETNKRLMETICANEELTRFGRSC